MNVTYWATLFFDGEHYINFDELSFEELENIINAFKLGQFYQYIYSDGDVCEINLEKVKHINHGTNK